MKVAVTGASGLIGQALARTLVLDGHDIVPIRRPGGQISANSASPEVVWDPEQGTIDAQGLEECDVVLHLAGEGIADKRWTRHQKARILDSRAKGTLLLADALSKLDSPPKAFLSGSAIGVYGHRPHETLTEDSATDPVAAPGFLADVCRAWEASTRPAERSGIRVCHLRTGAVLSSQGGLLGRLLPLYRWGLGGRLGSGRQMMSWISLTDEIRAIRWLMESDLAGPVNLTAPEPVSNGDFNRSLGHLLHRPAILPVPKVVPALVYGRELVDQLMFSSARVLPSRLAADDFIFEHPSIEQALRAEVGVD